MRLASWSAVRQLVCSLSVVCGSMNFAGTLQAQPAKPNPVAAKRTHDLSESLKKQAADVTAKYAQATGGIKSAADALASARTASAAAQEKISKAYEIGIASDITLATTEAAKHTPAIARALDLLLTLESEANFAADGPVTAARKDLPESALPQLEAWQAARKSAADAFGKVAAALTANAPSDVIETARDEAFVASKNVLLTNRALTGARDVAKTHATATKTRNEELAGMVADLSNADSGVLALMKQQIEVELKLRKLERQRVQIATAAANLAKAKKK